MTQGILVLSEDEIRSCVWFNETSYNVVEKGFSYLAQGLVTIPPILRIDVKDKNGEVDVKTAYIHGLDSFAIKIAAGFLDNHLLGLPTGSGMMVMVSTITGNPIGILLDNGYLTDLRTGIAGAISAKYYAPEEINTVGVIGSGAQARYQVRGLNLVRKFSKLMVYGIVPEEVDKYIADMSKEFNVEVIKAADAESVVRESNIVITTTPSKAPYLRPEWLHRGLHITCMGSDSEDKQEIHEEVFAHVNRIACDKKSQAFRLGELHHAIEAGVMSQEDKIVELGDVILNHDLGRQSEKEISICDLTGVGIQDTQIARLAYTTAVKRGLGTELA
jgi:ectoine utilization protein EutC